MATQTGGYGGGLLSKSYPGKTSEAGSYPAGIGGGIAQMMKYHREGPYTNLTGREELNMRATLEGQLLDLTEREEKWRRGLIVESNDALKQLMDLHKMDVGFLEGSARVQTQKMGFEYQLYGSLELNAYDEILYSGDMRAVRGYDISFDDAGSQPGLIKTTQLAFDGFKEGGFSGLDKGAAAQHIADTISPKLKGPLENGMGVGEMSGGLYIERKAEQGVLGAMAGLTKRLLKSEMPGLSEAEYEEMWREVTTRLVAGGTMRENYGDIDAAAMADRSKASHDVEDKVKKQANILRTKAGGNNTKQDRITVMEDIIMARIEANKTGNRPPEIFDTPSIYTDEMQLVQDQLDRLKYKDVYADEVLRIIEIDGFREAFAAMGYKGTNYETYRKAVFKMTANPYKMTKLFSLIHQAKVAGVPEAQRDVMLRKYMSREGMVGRGVPAAFDRETSVREKLAGLTKTQITGIDKTLNNYQATDKFQIVKAPMIDRYKEFQAEWLAESGLGDQAFKAEDGSLSFANAIAEGAWDNALASWLAKQKTYDQETGVDMPEVMGDELMDLVLKDSAFAVGKAEAIGAARTTDILVESEEEEAVAKQKESTLRAEDGRVIRLREGEVVIEEPGKEPVVVSDLDSDYGSITADIYDELARGDLTPFVEEEQMSAFEMVKGFGEEEEEEGVPPTYTQPAGLSPQEAAIHHQRWLERTAKERKRSVAVAREEQSLRVLKRGTEEATEHPLDRPSKPLTKEQKAVIEKESITPSLESEVLESKAKVKAKPKAKPEVKRETTLDLLGGVSGKETEIKLPVDSTADLL